MNTLKVAATVCTGLGLLVGHAQADISWRITSPEGITHTDTDTANALPVGSIWQLWLSNDATTIADINGGNALIDTLTATTVGTVDAGSGDVLLASGLTGVAGFFATQPSGTSEDSVDTTDNDVNNGFIYALVVFDEDTSASVTEGDWIGYTPEYDVTAFADFTTGVDPVPTPNDVVFPASSPFVVTDQAQAVPEPGTFALFALGLATIAWRRRKRAEPPHRMSKGSGPTGLGPFVYTVQTYYGISPYVLPLPIVYHGCAVCADVCI